ncbi:class II aldolase/adducin family protein [Parageobacillus sp. VR-IP]|uniref:class II aldolase/adducin family protein n=1 Tax=Parageobacillus sp. VR-IP TaxID=2742205 RepID=UPI0015828E60|nr:class II aldolase/adducin family protein [Parageobacillus sp. VR-IP]NUK30264.1 class II aldolase/adducin family protein [Parageobacillus sp. VR-IP]
MNQTVKQLIEAGRYMVQHRLVWGNAGNISAHTGKDRCLITATGTNLGELNEKDFVECAFAEDLNMYKKRPSKELPMHRAIYEERPEINAVLHAAPFYTMIVACSNILLPSNLFVESMYYLEKIERVPYFHPGSEELGVAVRKKPEKQISSFWKIMVFLSMT